MPRYRDVILKTWRANRDSYWRNFSAAQAIGLLLGTFFGVVIHQFDGRLSDVLQTIGKSILGTGLVATIVLGRIFYKELAANSRKETAEIAGTLYLDESKYNWEDILVCWKLIHTHEDVREVFCGITQELESRPTLAHLRAAKVLVTH